MADTTYPGPIGAAARSLHTCAAAGLKPDSLTVVQEDDGRRIAHLFYEDGTEVRVFGDVSGQIPADPNRCVVQVLNKGATTAQANGVPARGVGRVAKAIVESLRERSLKVSPVDVIHSYDEDVRRNRRPDHDTLRLVAVDEHGQAWLELIDHARLMGFDLETNRSQDGRGLLWMAYEDYRERLMDELGIARTAV